MNIFLLFHQMSVYNKIININIHGVYYNWHPRHLRSCLCYSWPCILDSDMLCLQTILQIPWSCSVLVSFFPSLHSNKPYILKLCLDLMGINPAKLFRLLCDWWCCVHTRVSTFLYCMLGWYNLNSIYHHEDCCM